MSFKEKKIAQFEFTWMRWPLALSLHNNPDNIMYAWFWFLIVKEERVHSVTIQAIIGKEACRQASVKTNAENINSTGYMNEQGCGRLWVWCY